VSPIIKSGYRSDDEKQALRAFYTSAGWKQAREAVLARAGGRCEFCGEPPDGAPLDVAHLGRTLEMVRAGTALDVTRLRAAHRRCHSSFANGRLG